MCTTIQYNNAITLSHMHTATVDKTKLSTVVPMLNYKYGGTRDTAPHFLHTHKSPQCAVWAPHVVWTSHIPVTKGTWEKLPNDECISVFVLLAQTSYSIKVGQDKQH